ncbi:MAG: methyltransferase domain-containing protein [Bacteroidota bacterium]
MSANPWTTFWKQEQSGFFRIMEKSTLASAQKMEQAGLIREGQKILDYGCGPGFFLDFCAKNGIEIAGVDINPFFIECCQQKHPAGQFALIPGEIENQTEVLEKVFAKQKFNVILLLSVAQYFESPSQLAKVVAILKPLLARDGCIVIADVVTPTTSGLRDAFALGLLCLRNGMVLSFIRFFLYLFFSRYRTASKSAQLRHYTDDEIQQIAKTLDMISIRSAMLTIHPTRSNYILSDN